MLDQDVLAAFDGLLWLRTGEAVAERLGCTPSTVSRLQRRCAALMGVNLERQAGEWQVTGDTTLLEMERDVHQMARFLKHRPLRLEATYWSAPLLCTPLPSRWLLGLCNIVGIARNLQLVRERIVDAWLAGLPDVPGEDDPELTSLVLCHMPVHLVAAPTHPLCRQPSVRLEDLQAYPSLGLPAGAYPQVEAALKAMGLWNTTVRMRRYQRELWEGQTEAAVTVGYGTALSLRLSDQQQVALPLQLPITSGEALVVRREHRHHPCILALATTLRRRLQRLAREHPEIVVLPDDQDTNRTEL